MACGPALARGPGLACGPGLAYGGGGGAYGGGGGGGAGWAKLIPAKVRATASAVSFLMAKPPYRVLIVLITIPLSPAFFVI